MNILSFPQEVLVNILGFLPKADQRVARLISRQICTILCQNHLLGNQLAQLSLRARFAPMRCIEDPTAVANRWKSIPATEIDFSWPQLTNQQVDTLKDFPSLKKLRIKFSDSSSVTILKAALFLSSRLESSEVDLSFQNTETLYTLATVSDRFSRLTALNFSNINLENDGIDSLVESLPHFSHLRDLNLNQNNITAAGAMSLAKILPLLQDLADLNLGMNKIRTEGAEALANTLPLLPNFQSLNVGNNVLSSSASHRLFGVAYRWKKLDLSNNPIPYPALRALPPNDQLTELNLSNTAIDEEGAIALKGFKNLASLDLSKNTLNLEIVKALSLALKSLKWLQKLNLDNTGLNSTKLIEISDAISNLQQLRHLNLSNNLIGDRGLANAIWDLPCLEELDLRMNIFSDEGAINLARCLSSKHRLKKVLLAGNKIGIEGIRAIANAIQKHPLVQYLENGWFDRNNIRDLGAKALVQNLPHSHPIKVLCLDSNNIENDGACAIAEALPELKRLESIELFNNLIQDPGAIALARRFSSLKMLNKVVLRSNRIGDEGATALAEELSSGKLDLCFNRAISEKTKRWFRLTFNNPNLEIEFTNESIFDYDRGLIG